MELSLFYFAFILFTLLSIANPIESDIQCPTCRRLLLFGGLNLPLGEKKSHHISSSSKSHHISSSSKSHHTSSSSKSSSLPSSPPKYARSSDSHGLTVYIRPQTSSELGHKVRSYTHLLKSKLNIDKEKEKLKHSQTEKKKQLKKKNSTQHKPSITTKTQELVAINDDELNRCKALLHIDSTTKDDKKTKKSKKDKSNKQAISSKVKNATTQVEKNIKKKIADATTTVPVNDKKVKTTTKRNSKTNPDEKKPTKTSSPVINKTSQNRPVTSPVNNIPTKTSSPSPPLPSPTNTKSKRNKPETITIIKETTEPFDTIEDEIDDKNNSVVGRAYHFVKNMFQLSDDLLDDNNTQEDQIIDITNEQQHHHTRKLLSIDDNVGNDINDYDFDLYSNDEQPIGTNDDLSFVAASISKRQLLSVKTNKHLASPKATNIKEKKPKSTTNPDVIKPKVGWAYRYRISRYLAAQKMKRTGNKNKLPGGEKTKQSLSQQHLDSKQIHKKTSSSSNSKVSKRKLLEYNSDDDSNFNEDEISDQDIVNSVSINKNFIPKRQLLVSKIKKKYEKDNNDDGDKLDKTKTRHQMESFEELTDPIAIVRSYDRGLYKPRVGWQFRYRVSRYIDSLRDNIREDQERLKLGLQAIKRKTPQELSGRRKRVLDKPFAPNPDELKKQEEAIISEQENKPHAGWRYRYRLNKMQEAKKRGDYIDDEEEKRNARLEQKKKQPSLSKPPADVDERIEEGNDLDRELRKISEEGRRVGWTYRYRIRRKLDHLKRQQAETGIPFDLATLSGKREKKVLEPKIKPTEKKTIEPIEQKPENKTKSVGWQYRYRVSKMREAQKREKHEKSKALKSKKQDQIPVYEQLDAELAPLTPEERTAGWKYRYRIQRKLDSLKNATTRDNETAKRAKKLSSSKRKDKEKIIKKVEESIEKILNIDDIDKTPFMEYFRRTSFYILFGLVPTVKKSICLLPLPITFPFCNQENNNQILTTTTEKTKPIPIKKLRTKKEQRAKQFIRSHITKLGAADKATERRIDETMRNLYKTLSLPTLQTPPSAPNSEKTSKKQCIRPRKRSNNNEKIKHFNEEDYPIKKMIGVESKKNKNKKQFQIIGKEVKVKRKHTSSSSVITIPPPVVEVPKSTTPPPPLRSISEVIQEEAATFLTTKRTSSKTPEEIKDEINEANESVQERTNLKPTTTATPPTLIDSTTSGENDNDSTSSDNDSQTNAKNTTEHVHDKLDSEDNKDSS